MRVDVKPSTRTNIWITGTFICTDALAKARAFAIDRSHETPLVLSYGVTNEYYSKGKLTNSPDAENAARFIANHSGISAKAILKDKKIFKSASRTADKKLHTDKGGSVEQFTLLQKAKTILEDHFDSEV